MAVGICEKEIGPAALPPQQAKSGLPPQRAKTGRVGDPAQESRATLWRAHFWSNFTASLRDAAIFHEPTPDSAGPCRSASGSGSIRGYSRGVPPALALSVRGNLHNTELARSAGPDADHLAEKRV